MSMPTSITDARLHHTSCPMDCPDTCALEVTVQEGRVVRVAGARDQGHPTLGGFICDKVAQFDRRLYHEDRLLYPMRRKGPKGAQGSVGVDGRGALASFERISWDEAIAHITARFRDIAARYGAEAILPYHYGGSNGFLSDGLLDDRYFARLGASRLARTLCAAPATEVSTGMYGKMPGVAFEDYVRARCIIVWGGNPKASNIHLVPFLKQARRNGAFVAVVDPRLNFAPNEVDLHLPVYPGADLPLALGLIRLWEEAGRLDRGFLAEHAVGLEPLLTAARAWPLERAAAAARVPAESIRRLAEVYADASPAVLRCGWGLERNRNGGQAIAAILAMPALLGKFGVPGGGYTLSNSGGASLDTAKLLGPMIWNTRVINMSQLGLALAGEGGVMAAGDASAGAARETPPAPPIQALFVYNCNPAATAPDQEAVLRGLAREDLFTVVHDQVMTDTARYADILLPATTFLEHHDVRRGYGAYVVGGVRPVVPACGEAKPNEEVFALLGRAMGFTEAPFSWDSETWMAEIGRALSLAGNPADPAVLAAGGVLRYDFPGGGPVQFGTVFPRTPDRKIRLTPPQLGPRPYEYEPVTSARYPLALISPSTGKMISSTFGEFNYPELRLALHPDDAAARGIADGDTVRVFNELGEVVCRAQLSDKVRPGVVSMPKGAWMKSSKNGRTSTVLCPATANVVGGGACFNDARVEVARLAASPGAGSPRT
ncbi:MAG TPA: molybdopterin-dependent oxidoreductase [Polyangia bacterium]|jgi:anaerobic selenocysteine-containing dehydrogenase|nr:molybdopterin-dependent oxidoreductase [Polyangia bacterium]